MKLKLLICFLLLSGFNLLERENEIRLEGIWVYEKFDVYTQTTAYKRKSKFADQKFGFRFFNNGKLKVHINLSACGLTPVNTPVKFETVDGTWELTPDSMIHLAYPRWGQPHEENFKLSGLTQNTLILKK